MKFIILALLLLLSKYSFSQISRNFNQKNKPIYEFGAGVIGLTLPNYPGAGDSTLRIIPFPWIIYRGDILKADEEGNRLQFFKNDTVELGLSGGFNFPIESKENKARKGMPDTRSLVGVGPGLIFRLKPKSKTSRLTFGLGVRGNFATSGDLFLREQGAIIEPNIRYWVKPNLESSVTFFSSISASFSDQKYSEFFYEVPKKYENETRKEYKAKSGLVDIATSIGFSLDITKKVSMFSGAYYSNLTLAANKHSPLIVNQHNIGYIFGTAWMFYEQHKPIKIVPPKSSDKKKLKLDL